MNRKKSAKKSSRRGCLSVPIIFVLLIISGVFWFDGADQWIRYTASGERFDPNRQAPQLKTALHTYNYSEYLKKYPAADVNLFRDKELLQAVQNSLYEIPAFGRREINVVDEMVITPTSIQIKLEPWGERKIRDEYRWSPQTGWKFSAPVRLYRGHKSDRRIPLSELQFTLIPDMLAQVQQKTGNTSVKDIISTSVNFIAGKGFFFQQAYPGTTVGGFGEKPHWEINYYTDRSYYKHIFKLNGKFKRKYEN